MTVRVRFAPSPTGYMHLGNVRTALFNWLFARGEGGTFILRIEDTDQRRHQEDAIRVITEGLQWIGMDWDEGPDRGGDYGPYFQSQRSNSYYEHAERLMEQKLAYACTCSARSHTETETDTSDSCRCKTDTLGKVVPIELGVAVRLVNHGGHEEFDDLVQGHLRFDVAQFHDFILIKSDGTPTYNYANVVDDHLMKITHIIRGDDHVSNTPRQLMLYRAFGYTPPTFAHLPQILGPDGSRLSKRHGAAALTDYRDMGFLPEALMNYLALLGWAPKGEHEFLPSQDLIREFELTEVRKSPAQFSMEKLIHLNSLYMKDVSLEERTQMGIRALRRAGILEEAQLDAQLRQMIHSITQALGNRLKYGDQFVEFAAHFFSEHIDIPEELLPHFDDAAVQAALEETAKRLTALPEWTEPAIEEVVRSAAKNHGLKASPLIHALRVALSASTAGPSLFTLVHLVGQKRVGARIDAALSHVS